MEDVKIVTKPWGWEKWLALTPFVMKEILTLSGSSSSVHVHKVKREINYVISGKGRLYRSPGLWDGHDTSKEYVDAFIGTMVSCELLPGDTFIILPGIVHRVEAVENLHTIETSTPEVDDVIRLRDSYGRGDGRIDSEHIPQCKKEENLKSCPCIHPGCKRTGVCCECIRHHLAKRELPRCCFPVEMSNENVRSFDAFVKIHTT